MNKNIIALLKFIIHNSHIFAAHSLEIVLAGAGIARLPDFAGLPGLPGLPDCAIAED